MRTRRLFTQLFSLHWENFDLFVLFYSWWQCSCASWGSHTGPLFFKRKKMIALTERCIYNVWINRWWRSGVTGRWAESPFDWENQTYAEFLQLVCQSLPFKWSFLLKRNSNKSNLIFTISSESVCVPQSSRSCEKGNKTMSSRYDTSRLFKRPKSNDADAVSNKNKKINK